MGGLLPQQCNNQSETCLSDWGVCVDITIGCLQCSSTCMNVQQQHFLPNVWWEELATQNPTWVELWPDPPFSKLPTRGILQKRVLLKGAGVEHMISTFSLRMSSAENHRGYKDENSTRIFHMYVVHCIGCRCKAVEARSNNCDDGDDDRWRITIVTRMPLIVVDADERGKDKTANETAWRRGRR